MTTDTAQPGLFSKWLQRPALFSPETALLLLAVFSRLIPHPPNFTAVGAVALFSGYFFKSRWQALLVSLGALAVSDIAFGYHSTMIWVYLSFALIVVLGSTFKNFSWPKSIGFGVASSVLFFVLSNFGVWAQSTYYAKNWSGLIECFVAAIPFFGNTLSSQIIFGSVLFAAHRILETRRPQGNDSRRVDLSV